MAVSVLQTATATASSNTAVSATFTSAVTAGSLLIAVARVINATQQTFTVMDNKNAGNYANDVANYNSQGSGITSVIASKPNAASGTTTITATVGTSSSVLDLVIYEVSGIATSTPLDVQIGAAGNSTAVSSGNATTTSSSDFLIGSAAFGSAFASSITVGSGWTAGPNVDSSKLYTEYQITSATGTFAATCTLGAAAAFVANFASYKSATGTSTPTVTSVNSGSSFTETATNVAVAGTNFASGMTSNLIQGSVSVAQPTTYTNATAATFNATLGSGTQLAYTDSTYATTYTVTVGGVTSAAVSATITPIAGNIFQTLSSVNTTSSYRITATPDLVVGDQLEASGNSSGTAAVPTGLQLNSDATYQFASGDTPANFWVRAYDSTNHVWGAWAEQVLVQTVASVGGRSRRWMGFRTIH